MYNQAKQIWGYLPAILLLFTLVISSCSKVPGKPANSNVPDVYGTVQFSGKVVDNAGVALSEMHVKIAPSASSLNPFQPESNSEGIISTSIYTNTDYTLTVYGAKDCNSPLLTRNFSTTNVDMSIGNLAVTGITTASVTGSVVDCNNNVVTSGYVVMQRYTKSHAYKLNEAGVFNFTMRLCNAASAEPITLIAQDVTKIQTGYPVSVTVSAGSNNTGIIKACFDSLSDLQFVNYTIDDTIYQSYVAPANIITQSINPQGSSMFIAGGNQFYGGGASFTIDNSGITAGSSQWLEDFRCPEANGSVVQPVFASITEFGAIGDYISGYLTGQVQESIQNQVARKVTCNFRVKRTQ